MTIQINAETMFILQCVSIALTLIISIILFIVLRTMKRMKKQLTDMQHMMYFNMKDTHQTKYMVDNMYDQIEMMDTHIQSLTDHIEERQRIETEKANKKVYPTPDVAKSISETIRDQISIEISLSQHLSAPPNDYVDTIIENVIKTYPNIDIQYISKKCFAMLEDTIRELKSE